MYVEFNDSENPERDWEISIEFYANEKEEYGFYITGQWEEQVRPEVPQAQTTRGRKAQRPRVLVHKRVLRSARRKKAVRYCR